MFKATHKGQAAEYLHLHIPFSSSTPEINGPLQEVGGGSFWVSGASDGVSDSKGSPRWILWEDASRGCLGGGGLDPSK